MTLVGAAWFDRFVVRLGALLSLWEQLRRPLRVRSIRAGALCVMPGRPIPLLVAVEGAGLLFVGGAVRLITDGGVWCTQGRAGARIEVRFRNLHQEDVRLFDVPGIVLSVPPPRPTVPPVRGVGARRAQAGPPARAALSSVAGVPVRTPSWRASVPRMGSLRLVRSLDEVVVHVQGMTPIHLVDDDDATLCRVAVIAGSALASPTA